MINKVTSENLEIIGIKSIVEKIEPHFLTNRAPGEDERFYVNSPGTIFVDVEVYVSEENKERLEEIEATGQPVVVETDLNTVEYKKYVGMIQNEIEAEIFDKTGNRVYLVFFTLLAQEMEGA